MPGAELRTRRRDGRRIAVVGEIVYELGPDARTLREIPYVEYAREAIGGDCPTLEALRERWLNPERSANRNGEAVVSPVQRRPIANLPPPKPTDRNPPTALRGP